MNNSNMMNRMLSNWLGLGVNHMDVLKFSQFKYLSVQLALVSACAVVMPAYAADQVTLTGINTVPLSNNETELRLAFNGTPPNPQAYQLDKPSRLVVDLPNAKSSLASRYQDLGSGNARSLAVVDNAERTRLVVNLNQASGYSTRVEGNTLVLKIGGAKNAVESRSNPTASAVTPVAGSRIINNEVTNIDFRRGGNGEGNVLVELNNPNAPVDVQQQGTKIIVRFLGTKLPERLRRRLDVNDFSTPIKTIDAYNEGNNGVLVIQPQGDFEYLSYQADNRLTISVKPVVQVRPSVIKPVEYSGQKLSLNFQDIEIRSVLQLIADFTGLNLVASDTVSGRITIRLQNVPWDQALDIVLKSKGLDKRKSGNVIMVAPAAELAAQEKLEIQNSKQVEQLSPLSTQYIQLNYAKAADILTLITSGKNGTSGNTGSNGGALDTNVGSLLSPRGTVSVDARTNTLIVQDTAVTIDKVRDMIARLDVPVKQVMIEARVVRASDSFGKELGVQWGFARNKTNNPNLIVGDSPFSVRTPGLPVSSGGLNVDLAATGAGASSIALGIMSISDVMLDLTLSALQADGKGEVIATPKVLTLDKQKATVSAGTEIAYNSATSAGAGAAAATGAVSTTVFKKAELSLDVTPSITPDGRVQMELLVTADTLGDTASNGLPTINTNKLQTNVMVDDGQTVVLGGIFQNQTASSTQKVPFLGDLPYLGRLFRHTLQTNNKQELLIFVTPRLVNNASKNQAPKPAQ